MSEILGFSNEIKADEVVVMDSKSIKLVGFNYDGRNEGSVHFWAGVGPQPSSKGHQVIRNDVITCNLGSPFTRDKVFKVLRPLPNHNRITTIVRILKFLKWSCLSYG